MSERPRSNASQRSEPAPGSFLGKYELVEKLGRGGMAEVWKARLTGAGGFKRTVVLKRILSHLAEEPKFVRMFLNEARLSAQLNHPNIVGVYELGEEEGEYFIAMEYIRGREFRALIAAYAASGQAPPPGLAAYVLREVSRALGYAHQLCDEDGQPLGLVHRDISPANIMVSFEGAVKLVDFGIAKAQGEANAMGDRTNTGTVKGKFGYMAPEQVAGRPSDPRTDMFSAGVVLWETLTGRRLFRAATDMETIDRVRAAQVPPPSSLNAQVPERLDRIALRSLAREPEHRYLTCEDMARDLDDAVRDLRWGPDQLAHLLRQMFPPSPPTAAPGGRPTTGEHSAGTVSRTYSTPAQRPFPVTGEHSPSSLGMAERQAMSLGAAGPAEVTQHESLGSDAPGELAVLATRIAMSPVVAAEPSQPIAPAPIVSTWPSAPPPAAQTPPSRSRTLVAAVIAATAIVLVAGALVWLARSRDTRPREGSLPPAATAPSATATREAATAPPTTATHTRRPSAATPTAAREGALSHPTRKRTSDGKAPGTAAGKPAAQTKAGALVDPFE